MKVKVKVRWREQRRDDVCEMIDRKEHEHAHFDRALGGKG